jgi:hypothetical protein
VLPGSTFPAAFEWAFLLRAEKMKLCRKKMKKKMKK